MSARQRFPRGALKTEVDEAMKAGRIPGDSWQKLAGEALGALRDAVTKYLLFAEEGDRGLIAELPIYTRQMVEACNRLARQHPEAMAGIAGECFGSPWPAAHSDPGRRLQPGRRPCHNRAR